MKRFFSIVLVATLMWSCGGKKTDPIDDSRMAKGGVVYGGVFNINEVEDFRHLFPHNITEVTSHRITNQIYQGLVKLDQATLKVVPCIAERWEINEDATKFTFYLRKGVKFHDDACFADGKGREVTANDFKYSLTSLCEASATNQMFWLFEDRVQGANAYHESTINGSPLEEGVTGIKVIDDYTLEIQLDYPFAGFMQILAHSGCWVFPKEAVDTYGEEMRVNCVGTGPFKLKTVKEGEVVILEKNEGYWDLDEHGNQLPYLDAIKFTFIKEKKAELLEFKKGNLDMVFKLPVEMIDEVIGELEDAKKGGNLPFEMQSTPSLTIQYYGFQHKSDVFNNKLVRQAFNYAIDRERLCNYTLRGEGSPALNGIVPPAFEAYPANEVKGYDFDPEKAMSLMAEAGYPGGAGFPKVTLQLNSGGTTNEQVAAAIQNMLKENLGVEVELSVMPFAQHLERLETGQSLFWRTAWVADYPDPENFLNLLYGKHVPEELTKKSYINSVRYISASFDSTFSAALQEIDDEKRMTLFAKADQIAMEDAAIMPIYYDEYIRLLQIDVKNFPINGMEYRDMSKVYFKSENQEAAVEGNGEEETASE